ncbi:type II toxin-antitoxin system VapC family toxin [Saccharopolyspora shandongensis]|uniref:PIN domain nuclease, a component of toxin-antitoxin system (PIN domain) n=1 Tax=Saccharopolyspora shandongensis TaxID=418495 RepID=A0A1H2WNS2_9PSEU|nr:type II toxin-antitoxin system VapC family toxin [Saccharopolyspora shandongensis]SDW81649.1 PIN domain nuclease, a component of toxin-antitoxin system (PIN domain) [Saccharopolyspora shandongensis]
MTTVLDTSAILAWLRDETGAETVDPVLGDATMSAVNWSELAQKLTQHGADARRTCDRLRTIGVLVEPFTAEDALCSGELWPHTRSFGLSLGDRACLAVALRLDAPVMTADKAWRDIDVRVPIRLLR